MLIQQNFSLAAGDDIEISLDIDPDTESMIGTDITFRVYDQSAGVPIDDAIITKDLDDGLQISDPDYGQAVITFLAADTLDLMPKNYAFEITTYDIDDLRTTVAKGIMTLLRTNNPEAL